MEKVAPPAPVALTGHVTPADVTMSGAHRCLSLQMALLHLDSLGHLVGWDFTSLPSDLRVPCARASVLKCSPCLCLSTGLFERHKLLFSFNMTIKIEQAEGRVPQEELDFFLKGNGLTGFHSLCYPQVPRTCKSIHYKH